MIGVFSIDMMYGLRSVYDRIAGVGICIYKISQVRGDGFFRVVPPTSVQNSLFIKIIHTCVGF